jgi:hypothetical protein
MAQVVGRELQLHALRGQPPLGQQHTRAVDEDMEWAGPVPHERGDRALVGEVEPGDMDGAVAARRGDVCGHAGPGVGVPNSEREVGAGAGQRAARLDSDPRRGRLSRSRACHVDQLPPLPRRRLSRNRTES